MRITLFDVPHVRKSFCTTGDGYDSLLALRNIFDEDSDKRKIVDFLTNELKERIAPASFDF